MVSGSFLFLIGILNLLILANILGVFRRMRSGDFDEEALDEQLNARGLHESLLRTRDASVRKPWHMYPLGMLFGLGFDTATEVALLFVAAGAAFSGLPFYAILCLPILFAAGMCLLDTIDGAFMSFAYGWAFAKPVRKVYYNITITGLSVAVALVVGSIELLSVLADKLRLSGGLWDVVANLNLNLVGYAIVALFVLTWIVALAVWRFGHIEERWSATLQRPWSREPMTVAPERPSLTFSTIEEVARELRRAGGRLSAARRGVLEALFAAEGPVSADFIASGLGGRVAHRRPGHGLSQPRAAWRSWGWCATSISGTGRGSMPSPVRATGSTWPASAAAG